MSDTPQNTPDYWFDVVDQAIVDNAGNENLGDVANKLREAVKSDFEDLKWPDVEERRKELMGKFKEAQILFENDGNLLDQADDQVDWVSKKELVRFADNLDEEFADLIREKEGKEGYSWGFSFVKDYVKNENGETKVFGVKISDAVKFMEKFGVSLGWLKAFVPEVGELEAKEARWPVEDAFKNVVGKGIAEKHLKMRDVEDILGKRDAEIASPDTTDAKTVTYEFVIKKYFDDAMKNFGGRKNLENACKYEKLSFHELVVISEAKPEELTRITKGDKTLREFLDGSLSVGEKVRVHFEHEASIAKIVEVFDAPTTVQSLGSAEKSSYQDAIIKLIGERLNVLLVSIDKTKKQFVFEGKDRKNIMVQIVEGDDDKKYEIKVDETPALPCKDEVELKKKLEDINKNGLEKVVENQFVAVALIKDVKDKFKDWKEVKIGTIGKGKELKMSVPKGVEVSELEEDKGVIKLKIKDEEISFGFKKKDEGEGFEFKDLMIDDSSEYEIEFDWESIELKEKEKNKERKINHWDSPLMLAWR